jgi:hypothetical protein
VTGRARRRHAPAFRDGIARSLAWHVVPMTVVSVLFVIVGVSFRTGWLY